MAKKKKNRKKKTTSTVDIAILTLILISVLLSVLIYTKSGITGVIGVKLNEILGGMMGIIKYVLPIGTFAIAIKLASEGKEEITSKLIQYCITIVSLTIVFSVIQISTGELKISKEVPEIIRDAYTLGSQGKGGGLESGEQSALSGIHGKPLLH